MQKNLKSGLKSGILAYILWGLMPIYWKQLQNVPTLEVLANRFIGAAAFILVLLVVTGRVDSFISEARSVCGSFKSSLLVAGSAVMISANCGIYIWTVEVGHILDASMGSYINPLVSVLLGVALLGERMNILQVVAVLLAVVGIAVMIVANGTVPWVSLALAVTFGLYGLLKKKLEVQPTTSILLETIIISPASLAYLYWLSLQGGNAYQTCDALTIFYLAASGMVMSLPMLLFIGCLSNLQLYTVGILQYLTPTFSLLVGVLLYGESFSATHACTFGFIWAGLLLFTFSTLRVAKKQSTLQ